MIKHKDDFFKACPLKGVDFKLGDQTIQLHELTVKQRSSLVPMIEADAVSAQANIVIMGCDLFDDSDLDQLLAMGAVIKEMADKICELSGLAPNSVEDAEKN